MVVVSWDNIIYIESKTQVKEGENEKQSQDE